MDRESCIERLSEARAGLRALLKDCEWPQIEAMVRNADMELHWALWNLGVVVPLRPEADYEGGVSPAPTTDADAVGASAPPPSAQVRSAGRGRGDG